MIEKDYEAGSVHTINFSSTLASDDYAWIGDLFYHVTAFEKEDEQEVRDYFNVTLRNRLSFKESFEYVENATFTREDVPGGIGTLDVDGKQIVI